jgi:hypothetical protein
MKNLAGNKNCDEIILEELYLANIPSIQIDKKDGGHSLDKMGQMEYDRQHIRHQR